MPVLVELLLAVSAAFSWEDEFTRSVMYGQTNEAMVALRHVEFARPDADPAAMTNLIRSACAGKRTGYADPRLDEALDYWEDRAAGRSRAGKTTFRDLAAPMPDDPASAVYLVIDLSEGPAAARYPVSYLSEAPERWGEEAKTEKLVLRRIEPGSFVCENGRRFHITRPYYIGVFELTQGQYERVMGVNPSCILTGPTHPVENVHVGTIRGEGRGDEWPMTAEVDADTFFGRLRARTGLPFDLPTEVQWEYACRAGTTSDFNNGGNAMRDMAELGCYVKNCKNWGHAEVGSYKPNAWGLYDMHGNMWEWCADRGKSRWALLTWDEEPKETDTDPFGPMTGFTRIARGGGLSNDAGLCRSGMRAHGYAWNTDGDNGFRVACPAGR